MPGPPGHVVLAGRMHNGHDYALARANLTIVARDGKGRELGRQTTVCRWVPAGQVVPFSVDFLGLPEGRTARFDSAASVTRLAWNKACLRIDPNVCRLEPDSLARTITVTGVARNYGSRAIRDVKVYCSFYTKSGEYRGTAAGSLEGTDRIEPGKTAPYKVVMDGNRQGIVIETVGGRPFIRLVGRTR